MQVGRQRSLTWVSITMCLLLVGTLGGFAIAQSTYGGITFPLGGLAFADRVVEYVPGSCVTSACGDPEEALGPPDSGCASCQACDSCGDHAVALGFRVSPVDERASLVVEFTDNVLVDGPGDDLFVFFSKEQPTTVEISADGSTWISVGTATTGCPAGFDIGPYVQPDEEFRYVRLTDVPADEGRATCPGACIDAIGAMGPAATVVAEVGGQATLQPLGDLVFQFDQEYDEDILFLMDTTGSMTRLIDGQQKIDIAENAVIRILDLLPDGVHVGFRTFAGCGKSNLISPLDNPLDIPTLEAKIRDIHAVGTTPLAYVLELSIEDCGCIDRPKTVVLVSDGIDTCGGDPIQAARDLAASGEQITPYVIGFDVGGTLADRDELIQIADILGGEYIDATDAQGLMTALSYAVPLPYTILDAGGQVVYQGHRGDSGPGQLPAGTYTVHLEGMPPVVLNDVVVTAEGTTTITVTLVNGELQAKVVQGQ